MRASHAGEINVLAWSVGASADRYVKFEQSHCARTSPTGEEWEKSRDCAGDVNAVRNTFYIHNWRLEIGKYAI